MKIEDLKTVVTPIQWGHYNLLAHFTFNFITVRISQSRKLSYYE